MDERGFMRTRLHTGIDRSWPILYLLGGGQRRKDCDVHTQKCVCVSTSVWGREKKEEGGTVVV